MFCLPQSSVGVVNVVGDCHCFGLATHFKLPIGKAVPIFLNVTGAASSTDALWAKLAQGKPSSVVRYEPKDAPSLPLEPDDAGLYVRYQKRIEGLGIDHLLLVHRALAAPEYPTSHEATSAYLLWLNDTQGIAKLGEHVRKTVKVAVFDEWHPYLHQEGRQRGLIKDLTCYGGLSALALTLDPIRWTALIAEGLHTRAISLPA